METRMLKNPEIPPKTGTGAPKLAITPMISRLLVTIEALAPGESEVFERPLELVQHLVATFPRTAKHACKITQTEQPGIIRVTKIALPPRDNDGKVGRPQSVNSIEQQILRVAFPGDAVTLPAGTNWKSVCTIVSRLKSTGRGIFSVQNSPHGITVTRVPVVTFDRPDGTQRKADARMIRGDWPFRAMEDGDAFTLAEPDHKGIKHMRATCNRYQQLRFWGFTPTENADGSITVQCHVLHEKPPALPYTKQGEPADDEF